MSARTLSSTLMRWIDRLLKYNEFNLISIVNGISKNLVFELKIGYFFASYLHNVLNLSIVWWLINSDKMYGKRKKPLENFHFSRSIGWKVGKNENEKINPRSNFHFSKTTTICFRKYWSEASSDQYFWKQMVLVLANGLWTFTLKITNPTNSRKNWWPPLKVLNFDALKWSFNNQLCFRSTRISSLEVIFQMTLIRIPTRRISYFAGDATN